MVSGIPDASDTKSGDIIVYPNPSSGLIRISGETDNLCMRVFSLSGNLVLSHDHVNHEVDVSFLSDGIYLLILDKNGLPVHRQILIRQ